MEKIAQRLDDDNRQRRAADGEPEKKFAAAQKQPLQSRGIASGVEMRKVATDGSNPSSGMNPLMTLLALPY